MFYINYFYVRFHIMLNLNEYMCADVMIMIFLVLVCSILTVSIHVRFSYHVEFE